MRHLTHLIVFAAVLGCEQSDPDQTELDLLSNAECRPPSPAQVLPFEGIYERTLHNRNPDSCESDGATLPASLAEPLLVVVSTDFVGAPVAAVRSCRDPDDCRRTAAEIRESAREPSFVPIDPPAPSPEYAALFQCQTEAAAALRGGGASVGNLGTEPGLCRLSHTDSTLQWASDGSLRVELRTRVWLEPERNEGECVYDAEQVPRDAPCSERETYVAQLLSEL